MIGNLQQHRGNAAPSRAAAGPPQRQGPTVITVPPPSTLKNQNAAAFLVAQNPFRRFGFLLALVWVFLRFSYLHEWLAMLFGTNTYLALILMPPTLLTVILSGGIPRTFRDRPAYYWSALAIWLLVTVPFSSWKTGSLTLLSGYFKTEFPILFIIAGMTLTWKECRQLLFAIGLSTIVNALATGHFERKIGGGRVALSSSSIGDANDLAAHFLLVLPFLVFVAITAKSRVMKIVSWGMFAYAAYLTAATGSRGALVAGLAAICFIFVRGSAITRIASVIAVPAALVVLTSMLPQTVVHRWATTFSSEDADPTVDVDVASREARKYLLKTSIRFTLENPIFGVGPGEFSDVEGGTARASGYHGAWQVTHNTYMQLSSEAGIPALALLIAALISSYRLLSTTYRKARANPAHREIATAAFCMMVALVSFCVCIFFLSMAYRFYLPAMSGLAIAVATAARAEFAAAATSSQATAA